MPGQKKWCECCHINLPFDKKAIQEHESTQRHIMNHSKMIKYQRIKIQREEKAAKQSAQQNSFISSANIPKAKKGSKLEQEVANYRNSVVMTGKMAIHQLIAEKTQGMYGAPIEYPNKEDLVIAENYQDSEKGAEEEEEYEMWKIDICEETGKACFINRITKAKVFEPPKGYVLSEEQRQEWEETVKICEQIPDPEPGLAGQIGEWEEAEEEDYFEQNKARESGEEVEVEEEEGYDRQQNLKKEQDLRIATKTKQYLSRRAESGKEEPKREDWLENLQQRVNNNEVSGNEVIESMMMNTLANCKNVKEKNETLKKLIKNDFEIRVQKLEEHDLELQLAESGREKRSVGFKARKKVKKEESI